jgi:hypothetical protein
MPTIRMGIIDGTGSADDAAYNKDMAHSFCRQLHEGLGQVRSSYWRGPTQWGSEVAKQAIDAATWLAGEKKKQPDAELMLAGYSRGGSAAIMAAEFLKKEGLKVKALFLFDAVARHLYRGGEIIPDNVEFSRHARRDQSLIFVLKYEATIQDDPRLGKTSNPTRPSFGNTGLQWAGAGDHERATPFRGSHGALGGVGWSFVQEDAACQAEVATWMNGHLAKKDVPVVLKSVDPLGDANVKASKVAYLPGAMLDVLMLMNHATNLVRGGQRYLPAWMTTPSLITPKPGERPIIRSKL